MQGKAPPDRSLIREVSGLKKGGKRSCNSHLRAFSEWVDQAKYTETKTLGMKRKGIEMQQLE
jgi:hypothetical protein